MWLPGEWDSFISLICARRKLTKFNKLWEECVQQEGRLVNREEKLNEDEDEPLDVHTRNGRNKWKDRGYPTSISLEMKRGNTFKEDYSSYEFYTFHKLGHISKNCPLNKKQVQK